MHSFAIEGHFVYVLGNELVILSVSDRYRIEQELGTEIKQIPPHIDQAIYCQ